MKIAKRLYLKCFHVSGNQISQTLCVLALTLVASNVLAKNNAVAVPTSQGRELSQVFALDCIWQKTGLENVIGQNKDQLRRALSSSEKPKVITLDNRLGWIEFAGLKGERHFAMPSTGSLLAGQFFTVFPDGRATRSQTLLVGDTIQVSMAIGHCEVSE